MASDLGLVGAGVMGANLALNFAERGRGVAVYDLTAGKAEAVAEQSERVVAVGADLADLVAALKPPRPIILMTPAGAPTDAAIERLAPLLNSDDILIDCGNADFHDTERRAAALAASGLRYLGVGVSGGAEGARTGPAIMAGGAPEAWDVVAPIFQQSAAHYDGAPCCAWLGRGGAGHFVKTIHNGVEYADMQMIAEVYGVLRDGLSMTSAEISDIFAKWNEGPLESFLVKITATVAAATDPKTGRPMLEVIEDTAGQKGTGRWSAIEALRLGAPASTIEAAVTARNISADKDARRRAEALYGPAPKTLGDALGDRTEAVAMLEGALLAGKLIAYEQGFGVLTAASDEYDWGLPLAEVARVWRAGCIIRAGLLNEISEALEASPGRRLLEADSISSRLSGSIPTLRRTVSASALSGLPTPALSAALNYFETSHIGQGTASLTQAQRDFFGSHGFRRIDMPGDHHGPW
ncbi:MAG: NADP-dependent phosphogluconate dehydrogenase [Rhodobacteraceae bacterium]|nr:NADP-dependent phosphogluconate dehydrogenase [Paracoccaceae bacterium]